MSRRALATLLPRRVLADPAARDAVVRHLPALADPAPESLRRPLTGVAPDLGAPGDVLMALGGALAASDRRYRVGAKRDVRVLAEEARASVANVQ